MSWIKDYPEEHEEAMISIMKDRFEDLGLDELVDDPEHLDEITSPFYWLEEHRGLGVAAAIAREAEQIMLERRMP